ncbi:uncharacterized protein K02A2.6-like [Rhopilema esculentum]|uniref:uncharacterized protein K02A2.6-like n=1 Tax=Rhopilema esculentum TaxID=499914 RepID=UPI0031DA6101
MTTATFYVVRPRHCNNNSSSNLISLQTAQDLGLVSLHLNKITISDTDLNNLLNKHSKVFDGLGCLHGEPVKLSINDKHQPKAQPVRRIPYHMRKKVEAALQDLEEEGIIERIPEHEGTPWVSPIVAVPKKDGKVRICVDMRLANEAIERVRHPIPTVDDVRFELNGAKFFTKLDLQQAYHQLPLHESSRSITTFNTHVGLFRYQRLAYGINASAEIFQYALQTQLQGLNGVKNIADDILVYGKTRAEHDANLEKCLQRLENRGLTLNYGKCKFLSTTLEFFGQIFSKDGTCPDPKHIKDVVDAPVPKNVHEVRSLLGMANYSSRYIANFATLTAPLRDLTKKNAQFQWTDAHQLAFIQLKDALTSAPCMAYFDKDKETSLLVDASPVGISAILSQKPRNSTQAPQVVAYASRSLTAVEQRYSQTEKEALAIVWSIEHFHLFLYGAEFTLITDHKPLEIIYGRKNSRPSARIERWVLRLQSYSFKVIYKSGADNPADFLSRHPSHVAIDCHHDTEEYINFIVSNSVPKAMTLKEISDATNEDRVLKGLRAAIRSNRWNTDNVEKYRPFKDELVISTNNIILRGSRIILPESLQKRAIDIAHETHQGLSRTKALLREKVWFFGIEELVKKTIDSCLACQTVSRSSPPEPIQPSAMPEEPWHTVHVDFYGPLPSNDYLLVVIDRYSRYPEVEVIRSTKASAVIPKLDKIFATHGIPLILKSDNGPLFSSDEFARYLKALGITHNPVTPCWPQANGVVERFNQPLSKTLQTAVVEGRIWRQELNRFLLQYRTTPHTVTKVAPCELLFNRKVHGKLPIIDNKLVIDRHKEARENEEKSQNYHKQYADNRRNATKSTIIVGDTVIVKQQRRNKLSTRFNETPYTVISRKGTRVVAENGKGHRITRNVSHFKKFNADKVNLADERSTDSEDEEYRSRTGNNDGKEKEQVQENEAQQERPRRQRRPPVRFGYPIPSQLVK